jgi:hypothetical protein
MLHHSHFLKVKYRPIEYNITGSKLVKFINYCMKLCKEKYRMIFSNRKMFALHSLLKIIEVMCISVSIAKLPYIFKFDKLIPSSFQ